MPSSQPPDTVAPLRRRYAPRMAPSARREQLLDAALGLIVHEGYEGVSVEAIARTAGVTRPVVYDHFPNLGRLLRALIEREESYAGGQLTQIVPPRPRRGSPSALLTASVRRFLDAVASRPDTWRIILLPPEGTPAVVREHVEASRARLLERLEELVAWSLERAPLPAELDVEICARTILRLCEEAARTVLTEPDRFPPERYERFVRTMMSLIWTSAEHPMTGFKGKGGDSRFEKSPPTRSCPPLAHGRVEREA